MKRKPTLLLILLLTILVACKKKPKEGYWEASFIADNGSGATFSTTYKDDDTLLKLNAVNKSHKWGGSGELVKNGNSITGGNASFSSSSMGHSYYISFTVTTGTCQRKEMKGTCTYKEVYDFGGPPMGSTQTGSGTFTVVWKDRFR
jgi:hypothetical protein